MVETLTIRALSLTFRGIFGRNVDDSRVIFNVWRELCENINDSCLIFNF